MYIWPAEGFLPCIVSICVTTNVLQAGLCQQKSSPYTLTLRLRLGPVTGHWFLTVPSAQLPERGEFAVRASTAYAYFGQFVKQIFSLFPF
ncbi:hypothetical protein BX600DRAFT_233081 [Xylariales sp. PMI_506]|nr:hypothetical protein BX600DRAFT_233081 [Xylariales sp. PMI_506]